VPQCYENDDTITLVESMNAPLLTIAVPTYNRAANLRCLLEVLEHELLEIRDDVMVLVFDNASDDETVQVLSDFSSKWPNSRFTRNSSNIGGDANICECADACQSKYLWIMGDDDLPKRGVVGQVLGLLREETPDLIYLRSEWTVKITPQSFLAPAGELSYNLMNREAFARRVHVWFTFISGIIVNMSLLLAAVGRPAIRRYRDTCFVQLGWVLNTLKFGSRFIYINGTCVVATSNNSGGYGLSSVFGVNYSGVVSDVFGRNAPMSRILIGRNLICYFPGLLWQSRFKKIGDYKPEDPWPQLRRELASYPAFWLLVTPIGRLPHPLAWPFFQAARVVARLVRAYDTAMCTALIWTQGSRKRLRV
jgi:glycosyltransferase involved in cell wall biosynthesis